METTENTYRGPGRRKRGLMAPSPLLIARADLADAIVVAARENVADARRRGDRSLLAGCEAALEQRIAAAGALRAELAEARA